MIEVTSLFPVFVSDNLGQLSPEIGETGCLKGIGIIYQVKCHLML